MTFSQPRWGKTQMNDKVYYWSDLAELDHNTQVEEFGFCTCEDGPAVYTNCPS
jgi:hypothetical protein